MRSIDGRTEEGGWIGKLAIGATAEAEVVGDDEGAFAVEIDIQDEATLVDDVSRFENPDWHRTNQF